MRLLAHLKTRLDCITDAAAWLVLPPALLLFAQWPLRDLVGAGSRQANDLAQWIFAVVALAIRHATRARSHLTAPAFTGVTSARVRAMLDRWGHPLAVLPFSMFVLVSGTPMMWNAVRSMESFPDTLNPGYFILKCAACLLALAMSLQALLDLATPTLEGPKG